MSALKAEVGDLEDVPEQYRGLYEETDAGFRLQVEGVEFESDVRGLKSALEKERQAKREAAKRLAKFEDIDADKYRDLLAEQEKREEEDARKRGEFDEILAKKEAKWLKDLEDAKAQAKAMEDQVTGLVRDQRARMALEEAGANVDLLLPHVLKNVAVVTEDGTRSAVVVNEKGSPRINDDGEHMTISELVAEMAETDRFRAAFPGEVKGGSGAVGRGAGRASGGFDPKSATDAEKAAFITKHGRDAYLQALGAKQRT